MELCRLLLVFCFGILGVVFGKAEKWSAEFVRTDNSCTDPLSCWLKDLVFVIPDMCFDVEGSECCITEMTCSGITIEGILSSYIKPTSLSAEISGLGTPCTAKWSYGRFLDGDLSAVISNTDAQLTALVTKESLFPTALSFPACDIPSIDIDLHFSGGLVGAILQIISDKVEDALEKAVYTAVCEKLVNVASNKTNTFLVDTLDPTLATIIAFPPTPPPQLPAGYVAWKNTPLATLAALQAELAEPLLVRLVSSLTHDTGKLTIDLHNTTTIIPISDPTSGSLGNITLISLSLHFNDLDTITNVLLAPSSSSAESITTGFRMDALEVALDLSVKVSLSQGALSGGDLVERFKITLNLTDISVGFDLLWAIDERRMNALYLDQFSIPCVMTASDYLSLNSLLLNVSISEMRVVQRNTGLEADIDKLINDILLLGVEGFEALWREVIAGLAQGPMRDVVNGKLQDILMMSAYACAPHQGSDGYVVWNNSATLHDVDYLLNTAFGVDGINSVMNSITDDTGSIIIPLPDGASMSVFGLNTFYDWNVLVPSATGPYDLFSEVALGYCEGTGHKDICTPFGISYEPSSLAGGGIAVAMDNWYSTVTMLAEMNSLENMQIGNITNATGCVLAQFDTLAVTSFQSSISGAQLDKGPVKKDITPEIEQILALITSDDVVADLNKRLVNMLSNAEIACETGVWPDVDDDDDDSTPCSDPISCALAEITIGPFDDLCFSIKDSVKICINAFMCDNVELLGVPSSYAPPRTFGIGSVEFGFQCSAGWSVETLSTEKSIVLDGEFMFSLENLTSYLELGFGIHNSLPYTVHVVSCEMNQMTIDLDFKGGVVGVVLNQIAPVFESAIEKAMDVLLCDILDKLLANALTNIIIEDIDPRLQKMINHKATPVPDMPQCLAWNDTILPTVHNLVDFLRSGDGSVLDCLDIDTPEGGININTLINYLTNNTGVISLPFNIPLVETANMSLVLQHVAISDLNTFHDIVLLDPTQYSDVTLHNAISMSEIDIQVTVLFTVNDYEEVLVVDLDVKNMTFIMDLVVAVNEDLFNDIYLDQITDLACLFSTLEELWIASLDFNMNIATFSITQVEGDAQQLEKDTVQLIDNMLRLLLEGYPSMMTKLIRGFSQGPMKDSLNADITAFIANYNSSHTCRPHANITGVDYIVWSTSDVISKIDSIFDAIGPQGINNLIDCVTNGTGSYTFPSLLGFETTLHGLDTFYNFSLVYPLANTSYDLANLLSVGDCNHTRGCNPFSIEIVGELRGDPMKVVFQVENFEFFLDIFMTLDYHAVQNLNMGQMHTEGCKMTTIDALQISQLNMFAGGAQLYLHQGAEVYDITQGLDDLLAHMNDGRLVSSINKNLNSMLTTSEQQCTHYVPNGNDDGDTGVDDWQWQMAVLIIGCILSVFILLWIYYNYGIKGMSKTCLAGFKGEDELSVYREKSRESSIVTTNFTIFGYAIFGKHFHYDALLYQERIPKYVRYLLPLAILGNIALFISANIAVGASVMVELDLGDEVVTPDPIFEFGLANTVRDMWNAGVYPLSILVAAFSGAWPYIKLAVMFAAWVCPTQTLSVAKREYALVWLDILGKWSLLDTYVMVMMMVAFYFTLDIADKHVIKVIVTVLPGWGFYAFLLATMCSLGLGHMVLACHRLVTSPKVDPYHVDYEPLMNHVFTRKLNVRDVGQNGRRGSEGNLVDTRFRFTYFGKIAVVLVILLSILFVVAGTFMNTFNFNFKGLVGFMLGDDATNAYSAVSLGTELPKASGTPHDFGVRWIQASYLAFGVGMPLAFLGVCLILWVIPLSLVTQRQGMVLAEVLNAWSALDVFVVSVVAALLEIQQFAAFIIGDSCDAINKILREYMDDELHGDDKCFDVTATLRKDIWVLYLAAALLIIVGLPLLALSHDSVKDRIKSSCRQSIAQSDEEATMEPSITVPSSDDVSVASVASTKELPIYSVDLGDSEADSSKHPNQSFWDRWGCQGTSKVVRVLERMGIIEILDDEA